jgi:hypothetical protein
MIAVDSDSLRFRSDRGEPLVLPTHSVAKLDRSLGKRSHVLEGLSTGLLAGMLIGLVAFEDPSEKALDAFAYGLGGAAVGLFVGGAVGAAIQTERWETVPPESWRLGLGFDRNLGFRLAVDFQLGPPDYEKSARIPSIAASSHTPGQIPPASVAAAVTIRHTASVTGTRIAGSVSWDSRMYMRTINRR